MSRSSHADLNRPVRIEKAGKIAAILGPDALKSARILEIGTGSGIIAAELAQAVGEQGLVHSIDVVDERVEQDGYRFGVVTGTELPFADESFDIVVSNHVIEHVGTRADQSDHVHEIHRVLTPGGVVYLACPSRWALMEPHFRLPFLSWIPDRAKNHYLRYSGRGDGYDCRLLSHLEARRMLTAAGFAIEDVSTLALRLLAREESAGPLVKLVAELPTSFLRLAHRAFPTIVLVGHRT